ncbi:DHA2 family efflux MFS transporter permease subunit [Amycolatopsis sp. NPDC059021]|uniref:DHA2 family efflux MFS transporter permease subunit n=1 Tax=Amycolatopsis sp. NPDC059021 TaxID=3346704 RepID=UPI0036700772
MSEVPDGGRTSAAGPGGITAANGKPAVAESAGTGPSSARWAVLVVVCLAQLMVFLDGLIVTVALPSIRADLGFTSSGLQWVVNAYTTTFAGFLLFGGRLADFFGQRRIFLASLAVFVLTSMVGGLAPDAGTLVVARAVQGISSAALSPVTLTILTTTFPAGAARSRALGVWSAVGAAGGAAGALLGGVLTESLGWRWILFINLPIGVAVLIGAWCTLPRGRGAAARVRLDVAGATLITVGLVALVYGIVTSDDRGWADPVTLGALGMGVALTGAFLAHQRWWAKAPLLPLNFFAAGSVGMANLVMFFLGAAFFTSYYLLSLYVQNVLHYSPLAAGLVFLPATAAVAAGAQVSGRLLARWGTRPLAVVGAVLAACGFGVLSTIDGAGTYLGTLAGPTVLFSFGIGLAFTPITVAATSGVEPARAGLASGILNTTRQVTGALAIAVFTTVATTHTRTLVGSGRSGLEEALAAGYGRAFLAGAAASVLAAALALRLRAARPR